MKIQAIQCKKCKDIIYSRAHHDFHWCSCESVAVDGGFDYLRICGNEKNYKIITINVKATKRELYDDWNHGIDKFGIIKRKESKGVKKNVKKNNS